MKLHLNIAEINCIINTNGGYVERLADNNKEIIYEEYKYISKEGKEKSRGGIFACVPNFGVDEITHENKHGYGREKDWGVIKKTSDSVVMELDGEREYEKLKSYLSYRVLKNSLEADLILENNGEEILNVAPAFHPYFKTYGQILIEDKIYSEKELASTVFINQSKMNFTNGDKEFSIETNNINTFALWTDNLDKYFCVEPTFNGTSFSDKINKPYKLKPGEKFEINMVISWK